MARVIIIGGGLAGLTAAFRLRDACQVVLLEAGERLGGQIHTERARGFVIERGAEGFVARSEAVPALVQALGMPADSLVGQSVFRSYGWNGRALEELRPGEAASFLGFQVPKDDLGKGIRSLRHGMGSLINALEASLRGRAELRLAAAARAIEALDGGVRVVTDAGALEADALIVATAAAPAARLLARVAGPSAAGLAAPPTLSSVTVELGFEHGAIDHPLDATGFVVALDAQHDGLRACTFTSSKFAERCEPGTVSLRLFFRPSAAELEQLSDADWRARAEAGLARVLRVRGEPTAAVVSRWPAALPVFDEPHKAAVAALEQTLAQTPIALAGSAFHGSGIDAAVRSGEAAALGCKRRFGAAG